LKKKDNNIVVIGGGAAGFFAAIACAEQNRNNEITLLEQGSGVLSKVKISGGGRCNVTNSCSVPEELVSYYPRGGRELLAPFIKFNTKDTIEWFEKHGVSLKTESDGRIFPVTDDSQTIVDIFVSTANKNNINILTQTGITGLKPEPSGKWKITCPNNEFSADAVILCSGSSNSVWKIISSLGHTIIPPVPSLFTFNIKDKRIDTLQGVSVQNAEVKVIASKLRSEGPLLITHTGLSGPAILSLSAWGARGLNAANYKFELIINWLPGINSESAKEKLHRIKKSSPTKKIYSSSPFGLPIRLWQRLLEYTGINENIRWNDISASLISGIASQLTQCALTVQGKSTFKEEFVTCGGVSLKEIDFRTMESKLHPRLYFAGEVMDIDAVTGGFNFQAAWTTGWIAGSSAAHIKN
jgi:predicted Rossmann fold flavoprotein